MSATCRVHIRKEALKFAAAHMTVFPDGTKEPLHGHNYRTEVFVDLKDTSLSAMVPFARFKAAMKDLCAEWDEKLLLAEKCPFYEARNAGGPEVEFLLCQKRYVIPREEVVFLPVDNITAESLAGELCRRFVAKVDAASLSKSVAAIGVRVDEMTGQGATVFWSLP